MFKKNILVECKGEKILEEITCPQERFAIRRMKISNKIVYENDSIAVVQIMGQTGRITEREKVCLNDLDDLFDRVIKDTSLLGYKIKDEITFLKRIRNALKRLRGKLKVTEDIGDVDLNSFVIVPAGDADAIRSGQKIIYLNCTGNKFTPKYYAMFYDVIDGKLDKPRRYHIDVNRRYGDKYSKEAGTVDHIDGNSSNNAANNLRWATHKENNENCYRQRYDWIASRGCFQSRVEGYPKKSFSTEEAAAKRVYWCEQQKKTEFTFDLARWRKDLIWVVLLELLGKITKEEANVLAIWIYLEKRKGTGEEICLERFNLKERFGFERR